MRLPDPAAAPRMRAIRLLPVLVLVLGYADLIRGGLTLAPLLLVASYVILVPLAFLVD